MEQVIAAAETLLGGMGTRFWPVYLPGMVALAWLVYRAQGHSGGFWRWLCPREVYFSRSHWVDVQLFVVERLTSLLSAGYKLGVTVAVAAMVIDALGGRIAEGGSLPPLAVAALLLLASDFSTYWVHRVHHEHPTLWPFHAVHHSAEVLTPVTVYRKHPLYTLISGTVRGVLTGALQGLLLALFVDHLAPAQILGVNAFYLAFNALTANLRHTHVWLSFGPVLERLFISPAQHQVHHSSAVEHHNRNYGEVLAVWDWMFGTLYVPARREALTFGVSDGDGNRIAQPHPTLTAALWAPLREAAATLRRRSPEAPPREPAE